jgi:hypothetical protein
MLAIALLFWWPLSHWLYPESYHRLLGFAPGSYPTAMVRVIGTCGFLPVFVLAYLALRPFEKWLLVVFLGIFSAMLGGMYLYLILRGDFPRGEYLNVGLCIVLAVALPLGYGALVGRQRGFAKPPHYQD